MSEPKTFHGIMVSSTFKDLERHRAHVIKAIEGLGYKSIAMEINGAADADVIDESLRMVRESVAYVGVISRKYGQTPECPTRNPDKRSITELEFDEATKQGLPVLLFIMSEKYQPLAEADIELDPEKRAKLATFRDRAKLMRPDGKVQRVYETFDSLENFARGAATALGRLALKRQSEPTTIRTKTESEGEDGKKLASPPTLAALPAYLSGDYFVGRKSELDTMDEWAAAADPNSMLLFEAIGGSGKSMVTWKWTTERATIARPDWAGRLWFSFYEKGAVMESFCRTTLAYIKQKPIEEFAKKKTTELADLLIAELKARPWLIVLDGLERVLVAYHRIDAAQMPDEDADNPTDEIAGRDPCSAIRPEDDELLKRLAAVAPSKILVSSRLTPAALINRGGQPAQGVRRQQLAGLRPADAEDLFKAYGIRGKSADVQAFLQSSCDCHPLVVGVLAGLINDYPADHGNFNLWVNDPNHGGGLDFGKLDLKQKRNHILELAIAALTPQSLQLLQILSLLRSGANYETLTAFNPYLLPAPKEIEKPENPENNRFWNHTDETTRAALIEDYTTALEARQEYERALQIWHDHPIVRNAPHKLQETIRDLERRGLMQFDRNGRRYDLHPVVRAVVAARMGNEETRKVGQKVVDYFSSQPHDPWHQAKTLDDVAAGIQVVHALLQMCSFQAAYDAFVGDLATALLITLMQTDIALALLKPFFPEGWNGRPKLVDRAFSYVCTCAALCFREFDTKQARSLYARSLKIDVDESDAKNVAITLLNMAVEFSEEGRLAAAERIQIIAAELADSIDEVEYAFVAKSAIMNGFAVRGVYSEAESIWRELSGAPRPNDRAIYRQGEIETARSLMVFEKGQLSEAQLDEADSITAIGGSRAAISALLSLRGELRLAKGEPGRAIAPLSKAVAMQREIGRSNVYIEALLALAQLRAEGKFDFRLEADPFSAGRGTVALAELWHEVGDREKAVQHALRAHEWAVADGEPYVRRHWLDRTRKLLAELGEPLPEIPKYYPSKEQEIPWEKDVRALVVKLKAERVEWQ